MIKLLLVGDASSIFFVEYVKAIKKYMDIHVTVYSPFPDKKNYNNYPYDRVIFDDFTNSKLGTTKVIGYQLRPFIFRKRFFDFLKKDRLIYDIIHIQWLLPSWTISPKMFHRFGKKLIVSFWGGEVESQKILFSSQLYLYNLGRLLSEADAGIGTTAIVNEYVKKRYPQLQNKCNFGILGSSIISEMVKFEISDTDIRNAIGIPADKITIMLGYSGKIIHYHIPILDAIVSNQSFLAYRDNIHFLVPMSRGASPQYVNDVKDALIRSGCTYTMFETYQADKEVAFLRKSTDIIFQLSHHDEVSTSIIENLAAGALMICGNWFPNYDVLRNYGFEWIEVEGIKEGVDKFYEILPEMDKYYGMTNHNQSVGKSKFAWDECIKDWVNAYKNILKS